MPQSPLHVLVVGGGLGGLCLAQKLKQSGVRVSVYERDRAPTDRFQGYRIHIDPQGSRALHESLPAPLFEKFAATCGRPVREFNYVTQDLEELLRLDFSLASPNIDDVARHRSVSRLTPVSYTHPLASPNIDDVARHRSVSRLTLRQILLEGLDEVVTFDKRFARYEESPDGRVIAYFEDGTAMSGDVLVAADGGNSRVRKQFLPHAERVETGILAVGGKVLLTPETRSWLPRAFLNGLTVVKGAKGRAMFCAPMQYDEETRSAVLPYASTDEADLTSPGLVFDNSSDYVFWAFSSRREAYPSGRAPGEVGGEDLRATVLEMVENWHPRLQRMVREADPSSLLAISIRTSVPITAWKTRNITLLGDAIHSMTPYRGIGANIALRDASLLGQRLAMASRGECSLLEAIHDYEKQMLVYGFEAVQMSLKSMEQMHAQGRISESVSRSVLKTINSVPMLKRRMLRAMTT